MGTLAAGEALSEHPLRGKVVVATGAAGHENVGQAASVIRAAAPPMSQSSAIIKLTIERSASGPPGFGRDGAMKAAVRALPGHWLLRLQITESGRMRSLPAPCLRQPMMRFQAMAVEQANCFEPVEIPSLGRLGVPDQTPRAAVCFASEMAEFVAGTTLCVAAGISAAGGWRCVVGDAERIRKGAP